MRTSWFPVLAASLALACGGDKDGDTGAECGPIAIDVTVNDPAGIAIEGADVTIDNETDCSDDGGGAYSCSVPGPGQYNLYAILVPDYAPFGTQITADCAVNPMSRAVTLNYENGGL